MSTRELNEKIETAYHELAAVVDYPTDLEPPASESDISFAEARLGISIPAELRIALRLFNGTNALLQLPLAPEVNPMHFGGISPVQKWQVVSGELRKEFNFWFDDFKRGLATVVGPVKPIPVHDQWIMITYGYSFYWFLDFCPEPGGTMGQLIAVRLMPEEQRVQVMAPNFLVFMQLMTKHLKEEKEL